MYPRLSCQPACQPDPFSYTFDYTVVYKSVLFVLFQHLDRDWNHFVHLCVHIIQIPSLKALALQRCTSLFSLSTSSILIRIKIILFIYASKLYTLVRLSICPSIQIPSCKALAMLRCTSLFCLSTSVSWSGLKSFCSFMRPNYTPSPFSPSLLLKLWLCCAVQVCSVYPLPVSWSRLKSFCTFMRPSYVSGYVSGPPSIHPSRPLLLKLWLCCGV